MAARVPSFMIIPAPKQSVRDSLASWAEKLRCLGPGEPKVDMITKAFVGYWDLQQIAVENRRLEEAGVVPVDLARSLPRVESLQYDHPCDFWKNPRNRAASLEAANNEAKMLEERE